MTTTTITLDMRIFRTPPPDHTKYDCLCDDCWHDYLELVRPAR